MMPSHRKIESALFDAPVTKRESFLAKVIVLTSAILFLALASFATTKLAPVAAFIPIYESALVIIDLITAVLLFGQFVSSGSPRPFVLANGYLFTAFMAIAHMLTFPGLFFPTGLLGATAQSTAWLYMLWHAGFPIIAVIYAKQELRTKHEATSVKRRILAGALTVLIVVIGLVLLTTHGSDLLPAIMQENHYTSAMKVVVTSVWVSSVAALFILWRRKPHTILDLWLMVTLCIWIFDIALSAILNAGRFDLGFYFGRIYGLVAASLVLVSLLLEQTRLYARLAKSYERELREKAIIEEKTAELALANEQISAFTYAVSHDLRAPLRAVKGYAKILEEDHSSNLNSEGRRVVEIITSRVKNLDNMISGLLAFSFLGSKTPEMSEVNLKALVVALIEELRPSFGNRTIQFKIGELGSVFADPVLVKQVIDNLLNNAIKYSKYKNPACIEIEVQSDTAPSSLKTFFVRDNGAGFDMKQASRLFQAFQRLHSTEEFSGSGIGLSTVRKIVEKHGGSVWADSSLGAGATFYFTLKKAP
jgi:signal transduction histidine kinase